MAKGIVFLIMLVLLSIDCCHAQKKVKYKDLMVLLNAKQYDQASPFLKRYVKDNKDNPNAFLFLGIVLQDKAVKLDVIKETELILQNADSAILNFEIAKKTIDEREVRRNDEYYQIYNRRDLRTGEFGVKLSDVKLDIENRIEFIKERKKNVRQLKEHYVRSEQLYQSCTKRFQEIKQGLPESKFYLTSNENTKESLNKFKVLYDSFTTSFENYKSVTKTIGKTGYSQVLKLQPIRLYESDGTGIVDFMQDEVQVWNFKAWADSALETLANEIEPIRVGLLKCDAQLNQLGSVLKKDSVSVINGIEEAKSKIDLVRLKKYDTDPLPAAIFDLKIAELTYGSVVSQNKVFRDSADINLQVSLTQNELRHAKRLDSLATLLVARNIKNEALNYADFVSKAYGDVAVISTLAAALKEYGVSEVKRKTHELQKRSESLRWIFVKADSVPLFSDNTGRRRPYQMTMVEKERFTVGLKFGADSLASGYFYTITPSRIPDVSVNFTVDKTNFRKSKLAKIKSLAIADAKNQIFFALVFSEEKIKDKYAATVSKIYRSDGLAWSFNYLLDYTPTGLTFVPETGDLSIGLTNELGGSKFGVIDKSGKLTYR